MRHDAIVRNLEREALDIAYRELADIGRLAGWQKRLTGPLAAIRALVPDIDIPRTEAENRE